MSHRPRHTLALSGLLSLALFAAPLACKHVEGRPKSTVRSTTQDAASKPASRPIVAKWTPRPFPDGEVN